MEPPPEKLSPEILILEKATTDLINKVKKYSIGITLGTCMVVGSVIMLAYYLIVTWHSETYKSIGFFLGILGSFLTGSSARKKALAQNELTAVEQQLNKLKAT